MCLWFDEPQRTFHEVHLDIFEFFSPILYLSNLTVNRLYAFEKFEQDKMQNLKLVLFYETLSCNSSFSFRKILPIEVRMPLMNYM